MPTYDYYCSNCHKTTEIFHSISQAPETVCPHCKQPTLVKQIGGGSGIIFKGSGFYETDYKTKKGSPESSSSKPTETPKPKSCGGGCACH